MLRGLTLQCSYAVCMCSPTDVVGFIEHHHCLLGELLGDQRCDLGVQQVGVVEDHHVSLFQLWRRIARVAPQESGRLARVGLMDLRPPLS